ncbi:MAG: flagellar basal body L-ring protein FlgH [Chromatiales bacterium]|nr:flagellar basal body L-ring protein FlgH [Chromatiales bacterium]
MSSLPLLLRLFGAAAATLLFASGCVTTPEPVHDPKFTPVYPVSSAKPIQSGGSIYRASGNYLIFEDPRAHNVGDLLTILLEEKTAASKKSSTSTGKDSSYNMATPTIMGAPLRVEGQEVFNNSFSSAGAFSGDGSTTQSNSLKASITVTVVDVLANGNLMIRGEKVMTINQGDEFIRLSGIIRPVDISPNNTVSSAKIANAEIIVGGNGTVANAAKQGWLGRFFNSDWWPF